MSTLMNDIVSWYIHSNNQKKQNRFAFCFSRIDLFVHFLHSQVSGLVSSVTIPPSIYIIIIVLHLQQRAIQSYQVFYVNELLS